MSADRTVAELLDLVDTALKRTRHNLDSLIGDVLARNRKVRDLRQQIQDLETTKAVLVKAVKELPEADHV